MTESTARPPWQLPSRADEAGAVVYLLRHGVAQAATFGRADLRDQLLSRIMAHPAFNGIVAQDLPTLLTVNLAADLATARRADSDGTAASDFLPLVVEGPTGTGKELLAKAIHHTWCDQTGRPAERDLFEPINAAGLPRSLAYSELFGHVKGAFTGATGSRRGHLVQQGGTVFIDEVERLPKDVQAMLLRALDNKPFYPLGSDRTKHVTSRIIAATQDLDGAVKRRRLLPDLAERLRGGDSLRLLEIGKRGEEFWAFGLPELVTLLSGGSGRAVDGLAVEALRLHTWQGNIRELRNALSEALHHAGQSDIQLCHLPLRIQLPFLEQPAAKRAVSELIAGATPTKDVAEELARARAHARAAGQLRATVTLQALGLDRDLAQTVGADLDLIRNGAETDGNWGEVLDGLRERMAASADGGISPQHGDSFVTAFERRSTEMRAAQDALERLNRLAVALCANVGETTRRLKISVVTS